MLLKGLTITITTNPADFSICAGIMAATAPWLAMEMDYDQCLKSFDGIFREVFVLKEDDKILGFVIIQPLGSFKGYIQTLAIDAAHRGNGYGTMLLQFCEERILTYSPNIFICVSVFNKGAIQLYTKFGFEQVGEIPDFIKTGFTELLLRKTVGPVLNYTGLTPKN